MQILSIRDGRHPVGAVVKVRASGEKSCPLIEGIVLHRKQYAASVERMLALFEQVAKDGLTALNKKQFHLANEANGIYELIAGDLRTFFFKASSGKFVVCTHMIVKHGQSASSPEVAATIKFANEYSKAEKANSLTWTTRL